MQNTFESLSQLWSEAKRPHVKHSTMCAYRLTLQTHLRPHFGQMRAIDEGIVQRFILEKMASGLSKKTVRDIVSVLRAIVKYGARHSLFGAENWELYYPSAQECSKLPVLSLSHQRRLMEHLLGEPTARNIGVLLGLCTGMRIGEICALPWSNVDMVHRTVRVSQTVGRVYNCDLRVTELLLSTPKTRHSVREIPITSQLFEALRAIRKQSVSPYVVGTSSRAMDPRTYRDYFSRLLERLQIPRIVFHGLRHTFATRCIESGCDYKTVSALLGHSNVSTTLNLYVHPDLQQKKRCIEKMNRLISM